MRIIIPVSLALSASIILCILNTSIREMPRSQFRYHIMELWFAHLHGRPCYDTSEIFLDATFEDVSCSKPVDWPDGLWALLGLSSAARHLWTFRTCPTCWHSHHPNSISLPAMLFFSLFPLEI